MENKVLAVVDGREITQSELYELLQSIGQNAAHFQGEEGQKKLVNELVMQELLYSDAIKNNLDKDTEYLEAVERMQKTLLKQYAMNKLLTSIDVTEDEVQAYFKAHQENFKNPESAIASHILVPTEEEALSILKQIQEGLDFSEAASQYSSCPSKAEGGNLGEFTRGRMVPEFEQAAFNMKVGEVSSPVKTQFGYHLIQLNSLTPAGMATLEEIKPQVKEQCLMTKRQDVYIQKQEELSRAYTIELK